MWFFAMSTKRSSLFGFVFNNMLFRFLQQINNVSPTTCSSPLLSSFFFFFFLFVFGSVNKGLTCWIPSWLLNCFQGRTCGLKWAFLIALGSRSLLDLWFRDSTYLNRNSTVAASAPVSERSVKLSDSQVPQGWGLLCQLLQRSRCRTCWGERSSSFWVQQQ